MEAAAERDGGVCCETDVRKLDLIPPPHTHTLGSRRGSEETAEVAWTRRLRVLGGRFFLFFQMSTETALSSSGFLVVAPLPHTHTAAAVYPHKAAGCDMRPRRYGVDSLAPIFSSKLACYF